MKTTRIGHFLTVQILHGARRQEDQSSTFSLRPSSQEIEKQNEIYTRWSINVLPKRQQLNIYLMSLGITTSSALIR